MGDIVYASDRIVVPPAAVSAPVVLTVRKGAAVTLRFVDSGKVITDTTHFLVAALTDNGMMVPAEKSTTGAVTTYRIIIPFETSVRITINGNIAATSAGNTVNFASGAMLEVKAGKNDPPLTFNYNVTGKLN